MTNTINTELTIDYLTHLLKQDGVNSKKQVVDFLNNLDLKQLRELRQDINMKINKMESERK